MAFESAVSGGGVMGRLKYKYGTFTNGTSDVGGSITTGLSYIFVPVAMQNSHESGVTVPKVSVSTGTLSISCDAGVDGTWFVLGK